MRASTGQLFDAQLYAEKRREAALKQQKSARAKQLAARRIDEALSLLDRQDQSMHDQEDTAKASDDRRFQLQLPEWMIDCPSSLSTDWLVMPRPEGKRYLLETSSRGHIVTRGRNGFAVHSLKSSLPASCCLDCIFHEPSRTFYALDLLAWNGHEFLSCDAAFRLSWLRSKMDEEATTASDPSSNDPMTSNKDTLGQGRIILTDPNTSNVLYLTPLPFFSSDSQGLSCCYHSSAIAHDSPLAQFCSLGFIPDGLSFIHKESHYHFGQSPLFVLWKDAHCSRYLLDTDSQGKALEQQQLKLQLLMDGTVATSDEPPVILGQLPASFLEKAPSGTKAGKLLRFSLGKGGIQFHDSRPYGADLTFLGFVNQRTNKADCFTKILFQFQARRSPISFTQILFSCAQSSEGRE
jgi:snurportin-1